MAAMQIAHFEVRHDRLSRRRRSTSMSSSRRRVGSGDVFALSKGLFHNSAAPSASGQVTARTIEAFARWLSDAIDRATKTLGHDQLASPRQAAGK